MVLSDSDFLQFQYGNTKIFEKVFWSYRQEIHIYSHNKLKNIADAEDVTAFAFFQLWLHRGKIRDPDHIKAFLYTTAHNKSLDILRKRHRRRLTSADVDTLVEIPDSDSSDTFNKDSLKFRIIMQICEEEIMKLPPGQKEVARLFFLQRRSMKEVAQIMDIDYKTASGQWTTVKRKLLKALKSKGIRLFMTLLLLAAGGILLKIITRD